MSDAALARALASEAGSVLLALRSTDAADDPTALRDAGDRAAQECLARGLLTQRPADAVLSEEAVDDLARLAASRVWIIDPLDGTREFSERDRVDWAVHVALWEAGALVAGAVALPALDAVLGTDTVVAPPARDGGPIRIAVSRTRPPDFVAALAAELEAELVPLGSAGYKICAVVRGEVDAYVHAGGQYEWDSAAPVALAQAAGLYTSRLDASPLRYNQPDPSLPDLVVCRPELADHLMTALHSRRAYDVSEVRS